VSFSAFAHHVRDPDRWYGCRVRALRSCVQLYRPLGFEATLSYLREIAGPYEADPRALMRALDALSASRQGWIAHQRRYNAGRRAAKALGHRRTRRDEINPYRGPLVWYGAVRPAALHAIEFWQRRRLPRLVATRDPLAVRLGVLAETCRVAGGELSATARDGVEETAAALRDRLRRADSAGDPRTLYGETRNLLFLAHLVASAADPARYAGE
jgi:hypothetical protein